MYANEFEWDRNTTNVYTSSEEISEEYKDRIVSAVSTAYAHYDVEVKFRESNSGWHFAYIEKNGDSDEVATFVYGLMWGL